MIPEIAETLLSTDHKGPGHNRDHNFIAHSLRGEGFDASEDGTGRGTPLVPVTFGGQMSTPQCDFDMVQTLQAKNPMAVAFERRMVRTSGGQPQVELNHCLRSDTNTGDGAPCVATHMQVRRLTPRECERLQGFPDDHTLIPYNGKMSKDGPRYKALGNSMAVPVMRWIGERIKIIQNSP